MTCAPNERSADRVEDHRQWSVIDQLDLHLRLGGPRVLVQSTRLLPFGENKITPFLTNVSFDVVAIC